MKQELLAPAGNMETFYSVIAAGANAVYLGGPRYGARAYAKNFTEEECIQAIHYAHLKGVKVYMTVNTLVKNSELEECITSLKPYYEAGLDGVIVQDIGVLSLLQKVYPDMELHASTQMSVSNKWGAKLLKRFGVTRVVPSRELNLDEIKRIREEANVEVETFVHGALCYSYSGQCLMSSLIGGRSGNRGRCAQPCRLPYELLDAKNQTIQPSTTLLSLKDLAMLPNMKDLADVPVDSLKIEGRMKQTGYAFGVVSLYRKYLDIAEQGSNDENKVSTKDWEALLNTGNREGFTQGYYFQRNNGNMITKGTSAHSHSEESQELPEYITQPIQESVEGYLDVKVNQPLILTILYKEQSYVYEGPIAQPAEKKPTSQEQISKQMNKTGNMLFHFSHFSITGDENVFLPVSALNQFRRDAFEQLLMQVLQSSFREVEEDNFDSVSSRINAHDLRTSYGDNTTLSISGNIGNMLGTIIARPDVNRIYLELDAYHLPKQLETLCKDIRLINKAGKECYLALPYVFRADYEEVLEQVWEQILIENKAFLARSLDSLGYLVNKLEQHPELTIFADETLYAYSNQASYVLRSLGCEMVTLPYELNKGEILHRDNYFSEMVIYGRIPVMITANCVKKTCGKCAIASNDTKERKEYYYLKDRKNARFLVETNCNNCGNIIYNSVPIYLMEQELSQFQGLRQYRIHITDESVEEVSNILDLFEAHILSQKNTSVSPREFTYGHFKRGVE